MDIGWGELLLLAGIAVLIFGPDRLPRAAADAGRLIRRLREMARSAQDDLRESAGVDVRGIANDLRSVADLHPKRLIGSAAAEFTNPAAAISGAMSPIPAASTPRGTAQPNGIAESGDSVPTFDPDAT